MKYSILLLMCIIIVGCTSNSNKNTTADQLIKSEKKDSIKKYIDEKNTSNSKDSLNNVVLKKGDSTAKGNPKEMQNSSIVKYQYNSDTLQQVLTIKYINNFKINFEILSSNKRLNESSKINGIASLEDGSQGAETDLDEDGNGYSSSEFVYKSDCWIRIRIDSESKDKVQIKGGKKCTTGNIHCPFYTVGVLKIVR